jgi:IS30 family transposase
MGAYKQLTYEQRCQIPVLMHSCDSQREVAEIMGVHPSTLSRELNRNTGQRGYRPKQAHRFADERKEDGRQPHKMHDERWQQIEELLRLEWSPEQVSGRLAKEEDFRVSPEWIYQYIWKDKRAGGDLYKHLRQQGKKRNKRGKANAGRGFIKNRVGIEERPEVVDEKSRVGDWEIDTVIGKNHQGTLVTLAERVSLFTLSASSGNKTAAAVTQVAVELLKPFKALVHTITADNGKEFAYHEKIAEKLTTSVYFARPYHSWERGLNENHNGLLRQYFPKSSNLKLVTDDEVLHAVNRLNHRPRKTLGYRTPAEVMSEHMKLPSELRRVALGS